MGWRMFFIICSSSFMLGSTFVHWTADHNTLWRSPLTVDALRASLDYYSILANASPLLPLVWMSVLGVALTAVGWRVVGGMRNDSGEGDGGSFVFDGGSLVLLLAVAFTQLRDVFPVIASLPLLPAQIPSPSSATPIDQSIAEIVRQLAGSNAVVSVALTGVILLQAGRTYADRSEKKAQLEAQESRSGGPAHPQPRAGGDVTAIGNGDPGSGSGSKMSTMDRTASPRGRAATPHRELSQEEAMELRESSDSEARAATEGDGVEVTVVKERSASNESNVPASPTAFQRDGMRIPRRGAKRA